jgi:hypothetical protein
MRILFSLIFSALFLSACAPSAGTSGLSPIELADSDKIATIEAGKTSYVAVMYYANEFGFPKNEYDKLFDLDFDAARDGEREVFWLQHKSSAVPTGWRANMHAVRAVRNIDRTEKSNGNITVYYFNRVKIIYAIQVPAGTKPGRQNLLIRVKDNLLASSVKEYDTPVRVNVVAAK